MVQGCEPPVAADALNSFDGTRLRDYAATELDGALVFLSFRGGRVHAGVHQARKSLRRARAVLALGMPALGPGAELLGREFGRLNKRLSKLRDAQALVEMLDRLIAKKPDEEVARILRRVRRMAARDRALRARKVLASDPELARRRALLAMLRAALVSLGWAALGESDVRAAWLASVADVEEASVLAQETGEDTDWHRWRRRVRRLSQQHLALGKMLADLTVERRHFKSLAGSLGEAQDYALLREQCGKRSRFSDPDRRVLRELALRGSAEVRARIAESAAERAGSATAGG